MTETELENLVVRLTGKGAEYQKMLADALEQTKSFAAKVTQTLASVAELVGFRNSLNAFTDYQDNLVRLETTVKSNGLAVEKTMRDYKEFADEIEATTRVSSIAATNLLAYAGTFDLVGEKAQKAVRMAVGLSQGRKGVSAESVIQALSYFWSGEQLQQPGSKGNYGMLYLARLLGIPGRGMHGAGAQGGGGQEKLIEQINKRLGESEEISKRLGQNFGGQLARINSYLQDIGVELGGIVVKWLKPFVDQLQKVVKWFKELNPAVKEILTVFMALATVLVAGGPIMRFFLMLLRLGTSISPLTVTLTAAAAATAIWVKYVGGLGEAWDIVRSKFLEFANIGLKWLKQFISEHQRLVLALGLATVAVGSALLAWKLLSGTIILIDGILTTLYIKQIAITSALWLWRAALLAVKVAVTVVGALFSGALWLGSLALSLVSIGAQIVIWGVWTAAVLAWNVVAATASGIVTATSIAVDLLSLAQVANTAATTAGGIAMTAFNIVTALLTADVNLLTLSLVGLTAVEALATFGLNILVGAVVVVAAAAAAAAAAFGAWELVVSPLIAILGVLGGSVGILTGFIGSATIAVFGFAATLYGGVVGGLVAAATAGKGFLDVLLAIPGRSGVLADIGGLFKEWGGAIYAAYEAMSLLPQTIEKLNSPLLKAKGITDGLSLAWAILRTTFELATLEIQGRWPSLWEFLRTTAQASFKVISAGWNLFVDEIVSSAKVGWAKISNSIKVSFLTAIQGVIKAMLEAVADNPGLAAILGITGGADALIKSSEAIRNALKEALKGPNMPWYIGMNNAINKAKKDLDELIEKQKEAVADAAKKGLPVDPAIQKQIDAKKKELEELMKISGKAAEDQKNAQGKIDLGAPFRQGEKEIKKWEATLFGSAEAYSRAQEYYDKINEDFKESRGLGGPDSGGDAPSPPSPPPPPPDGDGKGDVASGLKALQELLKGYMGKGWPVIVTNLPKKVNL